MKIDRDAAERAVFDFLQAIGQAPEPDSELSDTPRRVVEAYANDLLCGYGVNVASLLQDGSLNTSNGACHDLVSIDSVRVVTLCPHHLMPAEGTAFVAYIPGKRLIGLGTIARLVDACARRLALQEQIGQAIVQALQNHGGTQGAFCRLSLHHSCLSARGARQSTALVRTVSAAGSLSTPEGLASLGPLLAGSPA